MGALNSNCLLENADSGANRSAPINPTRPLSPENVRQAVHGINSVKAVQPADQVNNNTQAEFTVSRLPNNAFRVDFSRTKENIEAMVESLVRMNPPPQNAKYLFNEQPGGLLKTQVEEIIREKLAALNTQRVPGVLAQIPVEVVPNNNPVQQPAPLSFAPSRQFNAQFRQPSNDTQGQVQQTNQPVPPSTPTAPTLTGQ
jgi:hypothetical protein